MVPRGIFIPGGSCVSIMNKEDITTLYKDGCYGSSSTTCSLKPLFMRGKRRRFRDQDADDKWVEPWKLNLLEAYHLVSQGKLKVFVERDDLSAEKCWEYFSICPQFSSQEVFARLYACYRHLRAQGWVVKLGQTYGCNFTVYMGDPDRYHSQFCVLVRDAVSLEPMPWIHVTREMRVANQTGKELILCDVEMLEKPQISGCKCQVEFAIMLRWMLRHEEVGKERQPHAKLVKKLTKPVTKAPKKKEKET